MIVTELPVELVLVSVFLCEVALRTLGPQADV